MNRASFTHIHLFEIKDVQIKYLGISQNAAKKLQYFDIRPVSWLWEFQKIVIFLFSPLNAVINSLSMTSNYISLLKTLQHNFSIWLFSPKLHLYFCRVLIYRRWTIINVICIPRNSHGSKDSFGVQTIAIRWCKREKVAKIWRWVELSLASSRGHGSARLKRASSLRKWNATPWFQCVKYHPRIQPIEKALIKAFMWPW